MARILERIERTIKRITPMARRLERIEWTIKRMTKRKDKMTSSGLEAVKEETEVMIIGIDALSIPAKTSTVMVWDWWICYLQNRKCHNLYCLNHKSDKKDYVDKDKVAKLLNFINEW